MIRRAIFNPAQPIVGCISTCRISTVRYTRGRSCYNAAVEPASLSSSAATAATATAATTAAAAVSPLPMSWLSRLKSCSHYTSASHILPSIAGLPHPRCMYTPSCEGQRLQSFNNLRDFLSISLKGDVILSNPLARWGVHTGVRCFASISHAGSGLAKISGDGFSAYHVVIRWMDRKISFFICGVDPEGVISRGPGSCLSGVCAAKTLHPDLVFVGLGYLDREKIFQTFSVDKLLRSRESEPPEVVLKRDNGQFIPLLQYLLLSDICYYLIGRDRLIEMGALGRELLWRPVELYSLFFGLFRKHKQREKLSPSLHKVLAEDSSRYCCLKIHQLLFSWFAKAADTPQPECQGFNEQTFLKRWTVGRSESECALIRRAAELEKSKPHLPERLLRKQNLRILVVCDGAMQQRLAERISTELNDLQIKKPLYEEIKQLQDTSSTRFHLCLIIYFGLPLVTLCRFLWKKAKKAYLKYAVVGKSFMPDPQGTTVTVSGDEVLARLRGEAEEYETEGEEGKTNAKKVEKPKLEIVESKWLGLKHTVRNPSRD